MSKGLQQCSAMQQVVRLLGDLGERYGAEHTYFDLRTPADAIKLLCLNSPAFQQELIEAHEHGVGYRLIQAGTDLDYADLQLPIGSNDLILTPVIAGSGGGGGIGKVLAGVALVAFAVVTAGAGAGFLGLGAGLTGTIGASGSLVAGGFVLGAAASSAIGAIGLSLIIGGVSQMISPQPTIPKFGGASRLGSGEASSTDGPQSVTRGTDGRQSYAYTGAANTVGVGATIPVAYGEVLIGSHLLSANVEVTDESDPLKTAIKAPGVDTVLFGGEKLTFNFSTASGVRAQRDRRILRAANVEQKPQNTNMPLANGFTVDNSIDIAKVSAKRKEFDFIFDFHRGLFENVSGPGSTFVDGFVTYRVSLINVGNGPERVIATSQATIQGLLLRGQRYGWVHRIEHPDVDGNIRSRVEILNFRADPSCDMTWQAYGYQLGVG